jgi:Fe-S cluster assembly protein SufD
VDKIATFEPGTRVSLPERGFTSKAVEALSAGLREPKWVLEKRREAWQLFSELEPPLWRRTDISKLSWDGLTPYAPPQASVQGLEALPPKLHNALATYGERAGLLLQRDSASVHLELSEEARSQGVIWIDMHTAARDYPDLLAKYFMTDAVPVAVDKYTALHAAYWSGGTFLYVPRNVVVDLPFVSVLWQEMPQLAVFPHTLLIAEQGSEVTLVSELLSVGCDACPNTYHGGVTELYAGVGARVHFVNAQDLGRHVYDLRTQSAVLERDSHLDWLMVALGARVSRSTQHSILRGPGAEAFVTGLYLPDGRQHLAFDTLQDHVAAGCTSDLLYQGALLGRSRSVYEGTIRAWPGAQQTNAYQSNRNLLLSKKARADSLPRLEIEANDLRCSHGATVSPVEDAQVFYLMSRGIPKAEAVRLIVEGFFQPSLGRLPEALGGLRDRLLDAVAQKLRG